MSSTIWFRIGGLDTFGIDGCLEENGWNREEVKNRTHSCISHLTDDVHWKLLVSQHQQYFLFLFIHKSSLSLRKCEAEWSFRWLCNCLHALHTLCDLNCIILSTCIVSYVACTYWTKMCMYVLCAFQNSATFIQFTWCPNLKLLAVSFDWGEVVRIGRKWKDVQTPEPEVSSRCKIT